jgi:hypothetical protein
MIRHAMAYLNIQRDKRRRDMRTICLKCPAEPLRLGRMAGACSQSAVNNPQRPQSFNLCSVARPWNWAPRSNSPYGGTLW